MGLGLGNGKLLHSNGRLHFSRAAALVGLKKSAAERTLLLSHCVPLVGCIHTNCSYSINNPRLVGSFHQTVELMWGILTQVWGFLTGIKHTSCSISQIIGA